MVLFHAERHTTQSNFEFETTATFEARRAVPLVPPAREDMLGHARTHAPAQTRSIHKHARSAGARAHMQGRAGPMGSPGCRCTRPEHRAKARISVGCCVLCPSLVTAWHVSYRARGVAIAVWGQVAGCPDQCNEPKIQGKCKPRLPIPSHAVTRARARRCKPAHAHTHMQASAT
jgi:hypothetical protein